MFRTCWYESNSGAAGKLFLKLIQDYSITVQQREASETKRQLKDASCSEHVGMNQVVAQLESYFGNFNYGNS